MLSGSNIIIHTCIIHTSNLNNYMYVRSLYSEMGQLTAGKVEQGAVDRRHPEVGGASVEDHVELLAWSANGDLAIVLSLCAWGN